MITVATVCFNTAFEIKEQEEVIMGGRDLNLNKEPLGQ